MKNFTLLAAVLLLCPGAVFAKDYTPAELLDYADENLFYGPTTDLFNSLDRVKAAPCQKSIAAAKDNIDKHLLWLAKSTARSLCEIVKAQKKAGEFCSNAHLELWTRQGISASSGEKLSDADRASTQEESFKKCSGPMSTLEARERWCHSNRTAENTCYRIRSALDKLSEKYNS